MHEPNLVSLSLSAFLAVLVVLSFLAIAIRLLAFVFRERAATSAAPAHPPADVAAGAAGAAGVASDAGDAALIAALHAVIARQRPGARVLHIDETTPRRAS